MYKDSESWQSPMEYFPALYLSAESLALVSPYPSWSPTWLTVLVNATNAHSLLTKGRLSIRSRYLAPIRLPFTARISTLKSAELRRPQIRYSPLTGELGYRSC